MDALSATFHKLTLDPDAAIKNIQKGLKEDMGGFMPTSGTLSNDEGLIAFEKAAASQSRYAQSGSRMTHRSRLNMQHISDELAKVTKSMGGDPEQATEFFYRYFDNAISGKQKVYEQTARELDSYKLETKNLINEIADTSKLEPNASILLNETATDVLNTATRMKNDLYREVDPEHIVQIPKHRLKTAYKEMVTRHYPN